MWISPTIWTLSACTGGTDTGAETASVPDWTVLASELDRAVLAAWGPSVDDLWLVGSDIGDGPLVRHHGADGWESIETGTTGDLWWVWGDGAQIWTVGKGGRVLRGDMAGLVEEILDPAVTLFGVWGSGPADVWVVGGDISQAGDSARIWHSDGTAFRPVALPPGLAARLAIYKVWGRNADDVWIVGTQGALGHWDGTAWAEVTSPVARTLFTLHGDADRLYAVGGAVSGTILSAVGSEWIDETPSMAPQTNGVYVREGCDPLAAGTSGAVLWRHDAGWEPDDRPPATSLDFHAAWLAPDCSPLLVGGAISSSPLTRGIVAWGGDASFSALE